MQEKGWCTRYHFIECLHHFLHAMVSNCMDTAFGFYAAAKITQQDNQDATSFSATMWATAMTNSYDLALGSEVTKARTLNEYGSSKDLKMLLPPQASMIEDESVSTLIHYSKNETQLVL